MEPIVVQLQLKEEKKWSVRYDYTGGEEVISSLYIRKSALSPPWPEKITVTIGVDYAS